MSEVTRYRLRRFSTGCELVGDHRDGDLVGYADYAALAQQLADVAYLEAWAQSHPDREYGRWGVGVQAYDEDGQRHTAASLPALGARLRAIAENH